MCQSYRSAVVVISCERRLSLSAIRLNFLLHKIPVRVRNGSCGTNRLLEEKSTHRAVKLHAVEDQIAVERGESTRSVLIVVDVDVSEGKTDSLRKQNNFSPVLRSHFGLTRIATIIPREERRRICVVRIGDAL